jgi:hypothetical protein
MFPVKYSGFNEISLSNKAYFSRDVENLSPTRREALLFPPSLEGKGVRGLGFFVDFST